jgi:predicted transcriptional regulator
MIKPLCDVIFASEKRKQVLLLLHSGAKEMEDILTALDTTRKALTPQMKILGEHHLVSHNRDTYELTTLGKLIVDDMKPLLETIEVIESDIDYWGEHDLEFIPPSLLRRIYELGKCKIIKPDFVEAYNIQENYHEYSKKSEYAFAVTNFLYPNYQILFSELIQNGVNIYFIASKDLLEIIRTQHYSYFKMLIENKLFHLFVYPGKIHFLGFAFNDRDIILSILNTSGEFDNKHALCSSTSALEWGKELFEYYLKDSTRITEL